MWKSTIDDQELTFRLVGLNNQNFIMEDEQTGTWWQQVTGKGIAGPLKDRQLEQMFFEQVSWKVWSNEHPEGTVLESRSRFAERYWSESEQPDTRDGERIMPFPVDADPDDTIGQGDIVVALRMPDGREKAYPMTLLREQSPVSDRFGGKDLLIVVAADDRSVRAFDRTVDGKTLDFYRLIESTEAGEDEAAVDDPEDATAPDVATPSDEQIEPIIFVDAETQSRWDFSGACVSGPMVGTKLEQLQVYSDYWFDWKKFNPDGLVFAAGVR